ncbi:MAG: maleylacetoacetate isomerase [Devosiaceae bacterium]|nr:maleylacetoacetate isomerase [Devosiaceae bacterium MH13]
MAEAPSPTLHLHGFFRSSTSFRVRVALNLKGLAYDQSTYVLRMGEQRGDAYLSINPQGLVPTLDSPQGPISQSLAIIEWLDETYQKPALLPEDAWGRARVRSLAHMVALDVHPINNLRVLFYIRDEFGADDDAQATWFKHWANLAFEALETRLAKEPETGVFCQGDTVTLADICLAGQVVNNRRFGVDLAPYPTIQRIFNACMALPEFQDAMPDNQPDAG